MTLFWSGVLRPAPVFFPDRSQMVDPARRAEATLVLRVRYLQGGSVGKYRYDRVMVLAGLELPPGFTPPAELDVYSPSSRRGVPGGDCTVYLVPFGEQGWQLLPGPGDRGVSHAVPGFPPERFGSPLDASDE